MPRKLIRGIILVVAGITFLMADSACFVKHWWEMSSATMLFVSAGVYLSVISVLAGGFAIITGIFWRD